jgi:cob(I)alamin adenosyltransferase
VEKGLIHLYYGDGKGKTTAAAGLCIRAAGNGKQVLFSQFMKDDTSGEIRILKEIPGIQTFHSDFASGFYEQMTEEEQKLFAEGQKKLLDAVMEAIAVMTDGGVVVLDEITYAYQWNLIERKTLEDLLGNKPDNIELIMTGRNPEAALLEAADYVTEMKCEKHPFERGIGARRGIEY